MLPEPHEVWGTKEHERKGSSKACSSPDMNTRASTLLAIDSRKGNPARNHSIAVYFDLCTAEWRVEVMRGWDT
jgi:hypothetical protein